MFWNKGRKQLVHFTYKGSSLGKLIMQSWCVCIQISLQLFSCWYWINWCKLETSHTWTADANKIKTREEALETNLGLSRKESLMGEGGGGRAWAIDLRDTYIHTYIHSLLTTSPKGLFSANYKEERKNKNIYKLFKVNNCKSLGYHSSLLNLSKSTPLSLLLKLLTSMHNLISLFKLFHSTIVMDGWREWNIESKLW